MIYVHVNRPVDLIARSEGKGTYLSDHYQVREINPCWPWRASDTGINLDSGRYKPTLPWEFLR